MSDAVIEKMLAALNPEVVSQLKRAVELGKFPDGRRLTREQRELCMQAVIAWEMKNLPEVDRVGYIDKTKQDEDACGHDHPHEGAEAPVKFLH